MKYMCMLTWLPWWQVSLYTERPFLQPLAPPSCLALAPLSCLAPRCTSVHACVLYYCMQIVSWFSSRISYRATRKYSLLKPNMKIAG